MAHDGSVTDTLFKLRAGALEINDDQYGVPLARSVEALGHWSSVRMCQLGGLGSGEIEMLSRVWWYTMVVGVSAADDWRDCVYVCRSMLDMVVIWL